MQKEKEKNNSLGVIAQKCNNISELTIHNICKKIFFTLKNILKN